MQMVLFRIVLASTTGCGKESMCQAVQIELADLRSTLTRTKDDENQLIALVARPISSAISRKVLP